MELSSQTVSLLSGQANYGNGLALGAFMRGDVEMCASLHFLAFFYWSLAKLYGRNSLSLGESYVQGRGDVNESLLLRLLSADITTAMHLLWKRSIRMAKLYDRNGLTLGEFMRGDMYIRDMKNTKGHVTGLTCGQWHPTDRNT
eukprot:scaffold11942_cov23-Tisochrysis_lutea.AAC.1